MPEAVIVATARTPIGRANKGSLVDLRPDDLSATIVRAVLDKVPALDRQAVAPTRERGGGGAAERTPPSALPGIYIAKRQSAENVVQAEKVGREEMDEFAKLSHDRSVASQENGFFEREITPVTTPDGTVV